MDWVSCAAIEGMDCMCDSAANEEWIVCVTDYDSAANEEWIGVTVLQSRNGLFV